MATTANALVVDASVAAKWHLIDEPDADRASLMLRHFRDGRIALLDAQHAPAVGLYCSHARTFALMRDGRCRSTLGSTSATVTSRPSSLDRDVTPASVMPQGTKRS